MVILIYQSFLSSISTVAGASVPIILLMYIHFIIRKKHYKILKLSLKADILDYEKVIKKSQEEVDNLPGSKITYEITPEDFVKEYKKLQRINLDAINKKIKLEQQIRHIESFSFLAYISGFLDNKFYQS